MKEEYHFVRDAIKLSGITLVVYLFMRYLLPIVFPFFIAGFLGKTLSPLLNRIEKKRIGKKHFPKEKMIRFFASVVLCVLIAFFVYLLMRYIGMQLIELWNHKEEFFVWNELPDQGILGELKRALQRELATKNLLTTIVNRIFMGIGTIGHAFGGFVNLVVIFVAAFLIGKDYTALREKVMESAFGEVIVALSKDVAGAGGTYIKAQGKIMLIMMGVCSLGLFLMGNPYPVLLGVVIGIFDVLPFLGTSTVFLPWSLICFVQGELGKGCYLLFLAGGTALLRQILEPKLIGKGVGVNPLAVLISIYIGIQIYGWWGVILGPASGFLIWEIYRFT